MDDDKQDKASVLPGGDANKRTPPTIDLTASDVTDAPPGSGASEIRDPASDHSESVAASPAEPPSEAPAESPAAASAPRTSSILVSALTGAVAALLVTGAATLAGWPQKPAPVSGLPLADGIAANKTEIAALGARIAKAESDAAKPAPRPVADPALATRLDTLEKSLASLRNDIVAVRGQSEKVAAALNEVKSASPQGVMTAAPQAPAIDTSVIEERIGKIERATAALSATAAAPARPPTEDPGIRKLAVATQLNTVVRQGEPYGSLLAAAYDAGGDKGVLKPLDAFAETGVPTSAALCHELLILLPGLAPKPDAQPAPSGVVDRLQQSAAKLVRIQRVDAPSSGSAAILARATEAARRGDLNAAKRELAQLPAPDRAPLQAWTAKADAQDAALAASRQFASDTMTALSRPVR
jgi:hypothetical protein